MLQEEWSDLIEQIKDVTFNLLVIYKFPFILATKASKPDDAVVIVKEVFTEKYSGSIAIHSILEHLEFFENGNRIPSVCSVFQPA